MPTATMRATMRVRSAGPPPGARMVRNMPGG
jgi:hypothetical protein